MEDIVFEIIDIMEYPQDADPDFRLSLSALGFDLKESPVNEGTVYHVLVKELQLEDVNTCRMTIAAYLRSHIDDEEVIQNANNLEQEIADIENSEDFDDRLTLLGASRAYQCHITLYEPWAPPRMYKAGNDNSRTLYISCHYGLQYNALHIRPNDDGDSSQGQLPVDPNIEQEQPVQGITEDVIMEELPLRLESMEEPSTVMSEMQANDSETTMDQNCDPRDESKPEEMEQSLDDDAQFLVDLVQKGFTVHDLPGGHSVYRIIYRLAKTASEYQLRNRLHKYAVANMDEPEFHDMRKDVGAAQYRDEENIITEKNSVSSTVGLLAACKKYKININVHSPGGIVNRYRGNENARKTLDVSLHQNSHYNLLLKSCNVVLDRKDAKPKTNSKSKSSKKVKPTLSQYIKELRMGGLYPISMPKQGDSLLNAILKFVGEDIDDQLRNHFVRDNLNGNVMRKVFKGLQQPERETGESVITENKRSWGDYATIVLASQMFDINIYLHWFRSPRFFMAPRGMNQPSLHLLYTDTHYDLLGRIDDPSQPQWITNKALMQKELMDNINNALSLIDDNFMFELRNVQLAIM